VTYNVFNDFAFGLYGVILAKEPFNQKDLKQLHFMLATTEDDLNVYHQDFFLPHSLISTYWALILFGDSLDHLKSVLGRISCYIQIETLNACWTLKLLNVMIVRVLKHLKQCSPPSFYSLMTGHLSIDWSFQKPTRHREAMND